MSDNLAGALTDADKSFPESPVGSPAQACPLARGAGIATEGTDAEKKSLNELVEKIRNSGPKGKAFIEALEKAPTKTRLFAAKSAEQKDGTVISLARTGGGVTIRPTQSKSGDNEVYVDTSNLIDYTATDGSKVKETPEGLLLHEMATNAVKYGALSNRTGRVLVTLDGAGDGRAAFVWRETGGPEVAPTNTPGFGTRLLKQVLRNQDGEVTFAFEQQGFHARAEFPTVR